MDLLLPDHTMRNTRSLWGPVPAAFISFLPTLAGAEDAAALLKRAGEAMGAADLKSIRYSGEGTGFTFGQAFKPGLAWPRINVLSRTWTINYETGSMRDEITLSRAEPKGGGGYPQVVQQKNDQFVSGASAWNQAASGPVAGPRFVTDRVHQLWITPHGVIKAATRNNATLAKAAKGAGKGTSAHAVTFSEPGRFVATVSIGADGLVEQVESRIPDPVLGEVVAVTHYSDYRDFGGVKFPMKIRQAQGGFPVLDIAISDVQPNAPADIQVPDPVRAVTEKVTADKVAAGIWFIAGGSHNSVAIEMQDHLVLVESPLNDGRMLPVLEQVQQLAPGKPIRYLVNSHNHFDHSGGVRAAVAAGATVITQAGNEPYFRKAFAVANRIAPDQLAKSGRKPKFKAVADKLVLRDGARTIEIHRIQGSTHNDTFLMVYLPTEKLLIEADAFTPPPPNAPSAATPNPLNVNLIENIERLNLQVERILPLHGRVVPLADLYAVAGRTPPK
ncbi:MAG: MBL fold metallo-hydrolase [Betaproteobacteria bacterium]